MKDTGLEVKSYKLKALPTPPVPNAVLYIKADGDTNVTTYITDLNGVPYLLKDGSGGTGGIQTIVNTDGTISAVGTNNIQLNLSAGIKSIINSALQPGSNISELVNDEGYITLSDIPTQVVNIQSTPTPTNVVIDNSAGTDATILSATTTNAGVLLPSEKVKLNNLSNVNSGDQTSIIGISGTKSQYNTSLTDGDFLFVGDVTNYTDEQAQDSVGTILIDTTTIGFTYNDSTPNISATVKPNSITPIELSDNINLTEFVNNAGFETTAQLNTRDTNNRNRVNHTGVQTISTITNLQSSLDEKENKSEKNTANGYAGLGADGKIFSNQLPALAITDTFVVNSQAQMLALTTAETGDIAVRIDLNKTFILKGTNYSLLGDWQELITPTDSVNSVFGRTGNIIANFGDYNTNLVTETTNKNYQTDDQKLYNDVTSSIQTQLNNRPLDTNVLHKIGNETKTGNLDLIGELSVDSGIKITGGQPTVTTTPFLTTTEIDGTQGKIDPVNLPLSDSSKNYTDSKIPTNYSKIVYVDNVNPNSATIFDLNNPPTVNDNALKTDASNLYIGTDGSAWVYNSVTLNYVTKTVTAATSNFYLSGTTIDAGNNKNSAIERSGTVGGSDAILDNHFIPKGQADLTFVKKQTIFTSLPVGGIVIDANKRYNITDGIIKPSLTGNVDYFDVEIVSNPEDGDSLVIDLTDFPWIQLQGGGFSETPANYYTLETNEVSGFLKQHLTLMMWRRGNLFISNSMNTIPTNEILFTSSINVNNTYVDVIFNKTILSAGLVLGNFSKTFTQNSDTATNITLTSVSDSSGVAISTNTNHIRVYFTITGAPLGLATFTLTAASLTDFLGNTQTSVVSPSVSILDSISALSNVLAYWREGFGDNTTGTATKTDVKNGKILSALGYANPSLASNRWTFNGTSQGMKIQDGTINTLINANAKDFQIHYKGSWLNASSARIVNLVRIADATNNVWNLVFKSATADLLLNIVDNSAHTLSQDTGYDATLSQDYIVSIKFYQSSGNKIDIYIYNGTTWLTYLNIDASTIVASNVDALFVGMRTIGGSTTSYYNVGFKSMVIGNSSANFDAIRTGLL